MGAVSSGPSPMWSYVDARRMGRQDPDLGCFGRRGCDGPFDPRGDLWVRSGCHIQVSKPDLGLVSLQRMLTQAIQRSSPLATTDDLAHPIDELVLPSRGGRTPLQRLEIYREQFWFRHLANLEDDFPMLAWTLGGQEAFRRVAR